ncbi:LPXTG cell wall anchor domain-containing protein [Rhabdothermincola salaria]|uniref:LPXTG cell wall anchor domain-containing protein n=1 Tax=Rhabdothermincola salaria TaxID=2903142 RepID=UPI001E3B83B1|nr:LPXTG cell wall anchor domain-containing protein [Rhabdothermincola salaria]MCD9625192.1 LPXTG cell wall anchor domain-containing protein [Rhabdothermincola salaria]
MAHDHLRPTARMFATLGAALALVLGVLALGVSPAAAGAGSSIPLHNDTAGAESDCPGTVEDYWHFVFTPNDDSAAFDTITLNLDGDTVVFSGAQIIPNGSQQDNVFVAVPDGYALGDLVASGSSATYTGEAPNMFVLSHVCVGTGTTTTTTESTTTTTEATTTTTTTEATTTTSVLGTTTVSTPTTESAPTTAGSPTTGAVQAAEVLGTTQAAAGQLPYTGLSDGWLLTVGAAVLLGGTALVVLARRRLA